MKIYKFCILIFILVITSFSFSNLNKERYKDGYVTLINEVKDYELKIDKIKLDLLFDKSSSLVDYIEITNESPLVISGHSGPSEKAYFNDLDKLFINDEIIIYHNGKEYIYLVEDITYFTKKSIINIPNDNSYIYLITCDKENMTKQLIITAKITENDTFL